MASFQRVADGIESYLDARQGVSSASVSDVERHTTGWSRTTCSFEASWDENGTTRRERLVLRQFSEEGLLETDLHTEYAIMDAMGETGVPVPETYWYCDDETILGDPFFVVEHVDGEAYNTFNENDRARLAEAWERRDLAEQYVDILVEIHDVDLDAVPFFDVPDSAGVVEREIDYWESWYRDVEMRHEPILEEALRWFRRNPPDVTRGVVHGDYRIGNMLCEEDQINAVIDWELARVSDPLYDLGYASMPYIAGKVVDRPTELLNALAEPEWVYRRYEERSGRTIDPYALDYWTAVAIFSMITILLAGVSRFAEGDSNEVDHAWIQYPVPGLFEDLVDILQRHLEAV